MSDDEIKGLLGNALEGDFANEKSVFDKLRQANEEAAADLVARAKTLEWRRDLNAVQKSIAADSAAEQYDRALREADHTALCGIDDDWKLKMSVTHYMDASRYAQKASSLFDQLGDKRKSILYRENAKAAQKQAVNNLDKYTSFIAAECRRGLDEVDKRMEEVFPASANALEKFTELHEKLSTPYNQQSRNNEDYKNDH